MSGDFDRYFRAVTRADREAFSNVVPLNARRLAVHMRNAEPHSALDDGEPYVKRLGWGPCLLLWVFFAFIGWTLIYVAAEELVWWLK